MQGEMHNICLNKKGEVYSLRTNDKDTLGRIIQFVGPQDKLELLSGKVDLPSKAVTSAGDCHFFPF